MLAALTTSSSDAQRLPLGRGPERESIGSGSTAAGYRWRFGATALLVNAPDGSPRAVTGPRRVSLTSGTARYFLACASFRSALTSAVLPKPTVSGWPQSHV